jgi:hemoglobin
LETLSSPIENTGQSVFDLIGGEAGCRRLATDFYARVAMSHALKPLFPGKSVRCATEEFSAFLVQFFDGDPDQTQYRWWLGLRESHARFTISETQRLAWLGLMRQAVHSVIVDAEMQEPLCQFFVAVSMYIVSDEDAIIHHPELRERWLKQIGLDQLVRHVADGRDAEAIELARQFSSQPSIFVGIFAQMMQTRRAPLADFVVSALREDRQLASVKYNGRFFIHLAAGHSCLPVVQELLALGIDPNVEDGGGHTPLYRAASSPSSDSESPIVTALIRGGAKVDHAGGANRSTALHEAARFGSLGATKALLAAGANRFALDKKGLTPYDRAVNCRRAAVAALLSLADASS